MLLTGRGETDEEVEGKWFLGVEDFAVHQENHVIGERDSCMSIAMARISANRITTKQNGKHYMFVDEVLHVCRRRRHLQADLNVCREHVLRV